METQQQKHRRCIILKRVQRGRCQHGPHAHDGHPARHAPLGANLGEVGHGECRGHEHRQVNRECHFVMTALAEGDGRPEGDDQRHDEGAAGFRLGRETPAKQDRETDARESEGCRKQLRMGGRTVVKREQQGAKARPQHTDAKLAGALQNHHRRAETHGAAH